MHETRDIIKNIKHVIKQTEPTALVYLYGSYARGDNNEDSDIDILILLEKENITFDDEVRIKYPLYDIEIETGFIISPIVLSKTDWISRHKSTPFYFNIEREGIEI